MSETQEKFNKWIRPRWNSLLVAATPSFAWYRDFAETCFSGGYAAGTALAQGKIGRCKACQVKLEGPEASGKIANHLSQIRQLRLDLARAERDLGRALEGKERAEKAERLQGEALRVYRGAGSREKSATTALERIEGILAFNSPMVALEGIKLALKELKNPPKPGSMGNANKPPENLPSLTTTVGSGLGSRAQEYHGIKFGRGPEGPFGY